MLDRLVDILASWVDLLRFVAIVNEYEAGVVLRFGVRHRPAAPGLHFFWPFGIESLHHHPIVVDTQELGEQSLTTKDGRSVSLTGVVTFRVVDVEAALLRVQGERQALVDSGVGVIGVQVLASTWVEVISEDFWNDVTIKVRRKARRYGIYVEQVTFRDLCASKTFRILHSAPPVVT